MSSDTHRRPRATSSGECQYCEQPLSEARLAVQTYPDTEADSLDGLLEDGLLCCPDCASEPIELLENWHAHDQPPVETDRQIGEGYRDVADRCSFCTDPIESDSVVGVECYRRPGERLPAYANYTLCPECRAVFEEFLCTLRSHIRSEDN